MKVKQKEPSWLYIWFLVVKSLFHSEKNMNIPQQVFEIKPWQYFKVRFMYFFFHLPMDKLFWEYRLEQYLREEAPELDSDSTKRSFGSQALFGIRVTAKDKLSTLQDIDISGIIRSGNVGEIIF